MAWTTPSTWVAGDVLTAAQLNAQLRDNMREIGQTAGVAAAGTAFTPTLSGGWALGNSTYVATYQRSGRWIWFSAVITIGSTATKGTTMTAALPVTAASANGLAGVTAVFDDGPGTPTPAILGGLTTTTVNLYACVASTTYITPGNVTSTIPFTWATGDEIRYGGVYEAAS